MESKFTINEKAAPKDWKTFARWHKLACAGDPMTAEDRFKAIGGVIKKKNVSKSNTSTKKSE